MESETTGSTTEDQPKTMEVQSSRMKNPKKQEAGRMGAAVCKAKQKRLLEELTAIKERVYSASHPVAPHDDTTSDGHVDRASSEAKLHTFKPADWFTAIGLALLLAGVLWYKQNYRKPVKTQTGASAPPPRQSSAPDVFDME